MKLFFEDKFFDEEEREGFVVCEKMKRAWAAEMKGLSEIIRVCEKYNITYYAIYGTLLGAVRHKGYIPWDDDIDIALKRKDYDKLMCILPYELPKGYVVSSSYTDVPHNQPFSCVMNSDRILTEKEAEDFFGCPYIVGVDVYPLDCVPRDTELRQLWLNLYSMAYDGAQRCEELQQSGKMDVYLPQIEELCNFKVEKDIPLKKQLWRLSDRIAGMFEEDECDDVAYLARLIGWDPNHKMGKVWFDEVRKVPFENMQISIPKEYHKVLTALYGEEYMIPQNIGGGHEYPFYKKQEAYLKQR